MKIIAAFLALTSTAFTALPPCSQSVREISKIVTDPRLYELLGSAEGIDQIVRVAGGYQVSTRSKNIYVEVIYLHTGLIGPVPFELEFSDLMQERFR